MGKKSTRLGLILGVLAALVAAAIATEVETSALLTELAAAKAELARFKAAHTASLEPGVSVGPYAARTALVAMSLD